MTDLPPVEWLVYEKLKANATRAVSTRGALLVFLEKDFYNIVQRALLHYKPETRIIERMIMPIDEPRDGPESPTLDYDPDVVSGLMNLGYGKKESVEAARGLGGTIEEKMMAAMKRLGGGL